MLFRSQLRPLTPYGAPQVPSESRLNTNENPYGPSKELAAAIAKRVGEVASSLNRYPDRDAIKLREGLAAPLSGMGISFSSSLFGLAGSLVLGFLDLQMSQAQNRFHTELEDWLATTVQDMGNAPVATAVAGAPNVSGEMRVAVERLRETIAEGGGNKAATTAMANLAEAIQGLVNHMRTEQQMIRDWVDAQADQHREIRRLLELMTRERVDK